MSIDPSLGCHELRTRAPVTQAINSVMWADVNEEMIGRAAELFVLLDPLAAADEAPDEVTPAVDPVDVEDAMVDDEFTALEAAPTRMLSG